MLFYLFSDGSYINQAINIFQSLRNKLEKHVLIEIGKEHNAKFVSRI